MKFAGLVAAVLTFEVVVYGKNAWEASRSDVEARDADLAVREEKSSNTSLIA